MTIDEPNGASDGTAITGINNKGQIVGYSSQNRSEHAFVYTAGNFTDFSAPNSLLTIPISVNSAGQIIGTANIPAVGPVSFGDFIYSAGNFSHFNFLSPGKFLGSQGAYVNDLGHIAGNYTSQSFFATSGIFLEVNGTTSFFATGRTADSAYSVRGLNNADQTVGEHFVGGPIGTDAHFEGFVETPGSLAIINVPGAASTSVHGINDAGDLAGSYYVETPTLYDPLAKTTHGFVDIAGYFSTVDFPTATYTNVAGINNQGTIVGSYIDSTGVHGFLANPVTSVPEPASGTVLGAGVAGLGFVLTMRWRRTTRVR